MISLSSISSFSFCIKLFVHCGHKDGENSHLLALFQRLKPFSGFDVLQHCNLVYFCFESLTCYVHLFQGVERFSSYSGYGKTFEFKGDFKDQSQVEYAPSLPPIVFTTIQPSKLLKHYWN